VATGSILITVVIAGRLPEGGTVAMYAAWTVAALVFAIARWGRSGRPPLRLLLDLSTIATVVLVLLVVVGLPQSPAPEYGGQKAQLTVVTLLLPFVAALVVGANHRDAMLFLRIVGWMGVATAAYSVFLVATGQALEIHPGRFSVGETVNPIDLARSLGEAALIMLFLASNQNRLGPRVLTALPVVLLLAAMLSSGSRAPLLSLVIALPALLLTRVRDRRAFRRLALSFAALGVAAVVAIGALVPAESITRAVSSFGGDETVAAGASETRGSLWNQALEASAQDPLLGIGTGGFLAVNTDLAYPHNIFLEILLENGVFALLALILAIGAALHRLVGYALAQRPGSDIAGLMVSLIVFTVFNSFFSGDLPGNNAIWGWIGLGSGVVAAGRARVATERRAAQTRRYRIGTEIPAG
jgi:O-antigen ligase